jgi:NADH-quinone oxidoreductase subunit M
MELDALLSVVTFLPLATAVGLLGTSMLAGVIGSSGLPAPLWRAVGLASTTLTFLASLLLLNDFDPTNPGFQFVEHLPWLPEYGINYHVGIDGISLWLVILTTFLMPVTFLASWTEVDRSVKAYVFFMLFLETGMLGAFVSLNLFQFYVFWEVMLVPMYFIIGIWGGPRRVYAAVKFFVFTMVGSLLMLVALLVVYYLAYEQSGVLNFDFVAAPGATGPALLDTVIPTRGEDVWWRTQFWLFAAFALAFAIKVPMVPLHTWLPDAHVEAPTAGSVILAGVLLKMGTYGFVRFGLPLFPAAAVAFTPWMLVLALVGIVYGSLVAMVQDDVKKLVAYSSVAHLGFVMLGIFALNVHGLNGSVLQMVNHGISTGALFLLVGMIYERRHTRKISDFGGVAKPMPVFAAFFGLVTMSSIGLPLLNGFVGEFLILLGAFLAHPLAAAVATSGVVLAAVYMLWMYRRVMFGPIESPENRSLIDLGLREKLVLAAMAVPIVWIGVYPDPFLRRIEPSVIELLQRMEERGTVATAEAAQATDPEEAPAAPSEPPPPAPSEPPPPAPSEPPAPSPPGTPSPLAPSEPSAPSPPAASEPGEPTGSQGGQP